MNDTCGTLMARAYEGGDCLCGGIFGTGTNGAYVESIDQITKMGPEAMKAAKAKGIDKMVVNTECEPLVFSRPCQERPLTLFCNRGSV